MAGPIIVSLHVPRTDSPDDVSHFVAELNRLLGPEAEVQAELEETGPRRLLHLRKLGPPSR